MYLWDFHLMCDHVLLDFSQSDWWEVKLFLAFCGLRKRFFGISIFLLLCNLLTHLWMSTQLKAQECLPFDHRSSLTEIPFYIPMSLKLQLSWAPISVFSTKLYEQFLSEVFLPAPWVANSLHTVSTSNVECSLFHGSRRPQCWLPFVHLFLCALHVFKKSKLRV